MAPATLKGTLIDSGELDNGRSKSVNRKGGGETNRDARNEVADQRWRERKKSNKKYTSTSNNVARARAGRGGK